MRELSWQVERGVLLRRIEKYSQPRRLQFTQAVTDVVTNIVTSIMFPGFLEVRTLLGIFCRLWSSIIGVKSSSQPRKGVKRISWTCSCGHHSFDDFRELRTGAVADYETFLHRRLRKNTSPGHTGPGVTASSVLRSVAQRINLVQSTARTSDEEGQDSSSLDAELSQAGSPSMSISNAAAPSDGLYLLLCLPYKTRGTKLVQPDLEKINSDQDFFRLLKSCYSEIRGKTRSMLSLRTPRRIQFVQLELRKSELVSIRKEDDLPPETYKDDYLYRPMPAEIIPPLGENYMMHLFTHPDHADASAASDLEQVPKKLKNRLCVGSSEGKGIGWGVHFIEAWHYNLIWLLSFALVLLASFVFFICWAVLEHDIQGASGVAAYLLALATLTIGSVQAAFEMEIL